MLAAVHAFGGDTSNIRLAEEHFIRQYGVTYEIAYLDCLQKFKERTWQGEIQFVLLFPCHSRFYGFLNSSATVSHKSSIGKPNVPVFCTSQTKSYISDSDYVLRLDRTSAGWRLPWISQKEWEISIRKVLRPATSTQVFLGFPVSISKCSDGSQHSKLPLHASHVALQT